MKSCLLISLMLFFVSASFSQTNSTKSSHSQLKDIAEIRENISSSIPSYLRFKEESKIPASAFKSWLQSNFKLNQHIDFVLINSLVDELGLTHDRYQETYLGSNVKNAVWLVHSKNNQIASMNGLLYKDFIGELNYILTEPNALSNALAHIGAEKYKWEVPQAEEHLKREQKNPNASYFPIAKKVLFEVEINKKTRFIPTYEFVIYAHSKLYRSKLLVDAQNGEIVYEENLIHDADVIGTAQTAFSGVEQITTDSFGGTYRLRESGRGNGINTYNLQQQTDYSNAVDFIDDDNNWNNANSNLDQYAADAHYGAEMTYDYFDLVHNRNSIDNAGFELNSYIHYDVDFVNAFWDGMRMTYGDGNGTVPPLTTIDICGHEITHGLTELTAGLVYASESGGLNESFSDIFGTAVEKHARPTNWDWLEGGDLGDPFRSLSNPNLYESPDTYHGDFWDFAEEVHNISGVQNHWFYLLSEGGIGTNDNGDDFSVSAIGFDDAAKVAFRNLTVYLTPTSNYLDARFYSILAAQDLFGGCTAKVAATANAWYAVGVGSLYSSVTSANFDVSNGLGCEIPFTTSFQNQSMNGVSYIWNFGDGTTSTSTSPSHTYTNYGNYTVSLQVNGGPCGNDALTISNIVNIHPLNQCVNIMVPNSSLSSNACSGVLFDSGGATEGYGNNETSSFLIAPTGATSVQLIIDGFALEYENACLYDWLKIYDGPNEFSPLIGKYCGYSIPNSIISTTGSLFILFNSDPGVTDSGFRIRWECVSDQTPRSAFIALSTLSCNGFVEFFDVSHFAPTSWSWDFGDGQTSSIQNPTHTYATTGFYTVQMTATNAFGSDIEVKTNYIHVDNCVGVDEKSASFLEVYPNPTKESLFLKTNNETLKKIEIMDVTGRVVFSNFTSDSNFEIQLGSLINPGSYQIMIRDSENLLLGKSRFIKL